MIPVFSGWCLSGWYVRDNCLNLILISLSVTPDCRPSVSNASLIGVLVLFLLRLRCRGGDSLGIPRGDGGGWFCPEVDGSGISMPGLFSFSIL